MSLGPRPPVCAHEGLGNPNLPRRDSAREAPRSRAPPVPRAPRPKPKANSAGAYARDAFTRPRSASLRPGTPTKPSESRRPRAESPFTYARVNALNREVEDVNNQKFEMGPARRAVSPGRNHERGHSLGIDGNIGQGMPWSSVPDADEKPRDLARRKVLQKEIASAEQKLEWVPQSANAPSGAVGYHGKVDLLKRENAGEQEVECLPGGRGLGGAAGAPVGHGRRNVLSRERTTTRAGQAPAASACEEDVGAPSFPRRNLMAHVHESVLTAC